ncbi:MAG: Spx/MgsR family RNA polymerase-binding regulatory protein [Myxococcales bacterium]|nr:Spx/MgsR family RNA polymerase-binding regulatory protein [Myxococcales bacterium]
MSTTVYAYVHCSTCKKALRWLDARGVQYTTRDLVAEPIDAATLRDLWRRSGQPLRRFFNTHGQSYRDGDFKARLAEMDDAEALAALAGDGKLVKRPIVDAGDRVLIGFNEAGYTDTFG